jgi:hypothetical protein
MRRSSAIRSRNSVIVFLVVGVTSRAAEEERQPGKAERASGISGDDENVEGSTGTRGRERLPRSGFVQRRFQRKNRRWASCLARQPIGAAR